jgi:hypothetical protein
MPEMIDFSVIAIGPFKLTNPHHPKAGFLRCPNPQEIPLESLLGAATSKSHTCAQFILTNAWTLTCVGERLW